MSTTTPTETESTQGLIAHIIFLTGLGLTAASMSSGFIWASQAKIPLVYLAGFTSWSGYLIAHYGAVGVFVDDVDSSPSDESEATTHSEHADTTTDNGTDGTLSAILEILPDDPRQTAGFVTGIGVLVAGIAILAWFVRLENHLLGNVGSGMFLGGYVIAHYFDTGKFL